jgi:hypothetical protein
MPNVVHGIKLLAATLVAVSTRRSTKKAMYFIKVAFIRVDGVAVDPVHDVISWNKIIGAATTSSSGDVEINHLVLVHRLVAKMDTEGGRGVGWKNGVSKSIGKLLPSGMHLEFLGHPRERADFILILLKVDGGIELANDLVVEIKNG